MFKLHHFYSFLFLLEVKVTINGELFTYHDFPKIIHTVLPNAWTSVRDCPVRYVDNGYHVQVSGTAFQQTYEREFAHVAAIGWTQNKSGTIEWNCVGSLITETFVLTSASCTNFQG